MKNGKKVERTEPRKSRFTNRAVRASDYLFFFLPFFPFFATWFLLASVWFQGVLKVAKAPFFANSRNFIKKEQCERRGRNHFFGERHPHHVEILVFGAGAMGSFFGGLLSRHHNVTLIGRSEHVEAIRAHGLRITGKTSMVAKPEAATTV